MKVDVPFGDFLPDAPSHKNPGLTLCNNVFAINAAYDPIPSPLGTGLSVSGEVKGAFRVEALDDTPILIVGTEFDLYVLRGNTVTPSGLSLALAPDDFWHFEQQQNSIYATCKTHGLYRLPSVFSDNAFIDNPGSPPRASYINQVGDFMLLGDLVDIDGTTQPYRIRWGAYNNPTAPWVTDIGRQSGAVDMPAKFGKVSGIFGGGFDLIFQKNGISRIWYAASPSVFDKEVIEDQRGCPAPNSIVAAGGYIYFLAHDGFCRTDGSGVEVISSDRIWKWFVDELAAGTLEKTQGVVDWSRRSIVWSFYPEGFAQFRRQIIYNFGLDKWTTASVPVAWVVEVTNAPPSIDEDDPSVLNDNILDVDGPSFDSSQYKSRGRTLGAFVDGELHEFNGPNLVATFQSGDFQALPGHRSTIFGVFPLVELRSRNARAAIGGRDTLGEGQTFSQLEPQGSLGFCPVISDAWFHSVVVEIPASTTWLKASGFQIEWMESGEA